MENENKIENALRIDVMANIDNLLSTIENEKYEEFNANKDKNKKALLTSISYILGDFVNKSFNLISKNKKLKKESQKSIVEIFFNVFKEYQIEYITQCEKFGNKNENK